MASWCDADPALNQKPLIRCQCYDGEDSELCTPLPVPSTEATFCLNQCSGRGECSSGFCRCAAGSHGADCSLPPRADIASSSPRKSLIVGRGGALQPEAVATIEAAAEGASEAAIETAVAAVHAARPGASVSPRVFVYELPGEYNTFMLARREKAPACVLREYMRGPMALGVGGRRQSMSSRLSWTDTLYGAEVALHEALLSSPHRTTNPEDADFFFVPAYTGCFVTEFNRPSPRHWLCEGAHCGPRDQRAPVRVLEWHERLLRHLRTAYPYWNRSGGADHLWPFTHDEGACYAPAALRNAILLVHWGRTHLHPNGSSTYKPHMWRDEPEAPRMYGSVRCFDACKDLVLPAWRRPENIYESPMLDAETDVHRPRKLLLYFNGQLGTNFRNGDKYSFGLRQQLFALFGGPEYRAQGVIITPNKSTSYSASLASSTFCGVLPGWGWSGRFEDAVLQGCLPVILQDGIYAPWEGTLDLPSFALRVRRDDMPRLLDILRAVPPERVAQMQAALRRAWPRYTYLGNALAEHRRRPGVLLGSNAPPPEPEVLDGLARRDATATLLQQLRARLALRLVRRGAIRGADAATSLDVDHRPDGCVATEYGNIGEELWKFSENSETHAST